MHFPEWSLLMARINRSLNELFTNTAADENIIQIYAFPVLRSLQLKKKFTTDWIYISVALSAIYLSF